MNDPAARPSKSRRVAVVVPHVVPCVPVEIPSGVRPASRVDLQLLLRAEAEGWEPKDVSVAIPKGPACQVHKSAALVGDDHDLVIQAGVRAVVGTRRVELDTQDLDAVAA